VPVLLHCSSVVDDHADCARNPRRQSNDPILVGRGGAANIVMPAEEDEVLKGRRKDGTVADGEVADDKTQHHHHAGADKGVFGKIVGSMFGSK
jgi:hypothetical protein